MNNKLLIYNHGKDSKPWGQKTQVFADIAKAYDFDVISPDYRGQFDPDARVEQLLQIDLSGYEEVMLVGSSMGAYVSLVVAPKLKPHALFLLAPAVFLPGYQQTDFKVNTPRIQVVHGWQDEIVPVANAWRLCQHQHWPLKLYNADHRLLDVLPEIAKNFTRMLDCTLQNSSQ